jgi:hypothetical protein
MAGARSVKSFYPAPSGFIMATLGRRLGDILIEERLITPAQRDEALRQQRLHGGRIGTNLVELGAVELEGLTRALARQKGVPAALQKHFDSIHREAVDLVPAQLAQKHCAVPLGFTSRNPKTLAVAFLDPAKPGAINEIQFAASARIYPVIAPELRIFLYLEKLYGIRRQIRFLRMERPSPDAAGRGQPMSAPAAQQAPVYLSAPETTPAGTIPALNPQAFFDMTRPDLSQPHIRAAILLTEAVAPDSSSPPPQLRGPTAQATGQSQTTTRASRKTDSQSQGSLGKAALSAKTASSSAAANPKPRAGEASSGARAQPSPEPAAAAPPVQGGSTARRPTRQGTPPPLPVSESRTRSPSTPSQSGASGAPQQLAPAATGAPASSSTQLQGAPPAAAAAKPKPPTPVPAARRSDRNDASSKAPTIPDIPAFAIDLEIAPHAAVTPEPPRTDEAKPAAPTIKIDFGPDGEPQQGGAPTNEAARAGAASPEPPSVLQRTTSAGTSLPSRAEPASSATATRMHAEFTSLPIDELWGNASDSPIEAAITDEPGPTPASGISRGLRRDAAESPRSPLLPSSDVNLEDPVARPSALESAPSVKPTRQMPDLQAASISQDAAGLAPAHPKTTGDPTRRPWSATEAVDAIAVANSRDQIADAIVNYLRSTCGVGLVMIVQHEVAMGWKGFAPGLNEEAIGSLGLPLAAPSILQIAYRRQTIFSGSPPPEGAQLDQHFWQVLRSPAPKEAIVAPIILRDRVVNLIYGHAGDGGALPDRALVQIGMLCRAAAAAYVRLIQSAKAKGNS